MRLKNKSQKEKTTHQIEELKASIEKLKEDIREKEHLLEEKENFYQVSFLSAILNNESLFFFVYSKNTQKVVFVAEPSDFFGADIDANLTSFLEAINNDDRDKIKLLFETDGKVGQKSEVFRLKANLKDIKDQRIFRLTINYDKVEELSNDECLVTIQNITKETKQQKEIIKVKEKAEESDKLKNIFLAKISQYIRTPMNSIVGFSELLTIYDPGEKQRKEFLDVIKRQSKTLLNIVNDISEIARYSLGDIEIKKTNIDLNLVLKELVIGLEQLRPEKRKEEVKISTSFADPKSFKLYSDSGRIQQIVSNISSHILGSIDKGEIVIGYNLPEDSRFEIFISDSSTAIPKEKQKDYFNQYTFSEDDSISKYDESGIGLAIARVVIKALNGRIQLESDEEIGTRFIINLPFEEIPQWEEKKTIEESDAENKFNFRNKVILAVDDEEVNLMFLEAVISNTQAKTLYAKNGYEAIELCKSIPKIDLILMDILMPGMNGIKTTSEIRKFNPKVPIIAQTALNEDEDHENCLKAGCNNTITKPIDIEQLLGLMDFYLSDE